MKRLPHLKLSVLTKISLVAFLITAAVAAGLGWGIQHQMEQDALQQAAGSAARQVSVVLNPNLKSADLAGPLPPLRYGEIDTLIQQNILQEHIVRVKIWNRDGLLVYSDEKDLVGRNFPVSGELKEALAGKTAMDISSLEKEENIGERGRFARLIEVYVPLRPNNSPQAEGAYEIYYDISALEPGIARTRNFIWTSIGLGFLMLYGSLFMLVRNASHELIHRNEENARLYNESQQLLADRKQNEEELRAAVARLGEEKAKTGAIIAAIGDGISIQDTDFKILYQNQICKDFVGDHKGEYCYRAYESRDHVCEGCPVAKTFTDGRIHSAERSAPTDNGMSYFEITASPLRDSKGKIVAGIEVARDITERKKVEEIRIENDRLAYVSKAKSEFLASMSHELRTPLNSITGFSELLKQKSAGELNEKQEHYLDNILISSKFLLDIINDILDLSKVEAGKIELVIEKISVAQTINETIVLIKERAARHNVIIEKEFDPELNFIEADRQRLKQILFNLLSNAVKFSKKEGGTVTISTKKVQDMAKISVSDTGIGIREEDLGKLFMEFGQVNTVISREYGGTGLGLAISKKLVEMHGGNITVESKCGEGSIFTFLLPLAANKNKGK